MQPPAAHGWLYAQLWGVTCTPTSPSETYQVGCFSLSVFLLELQVCSTSAFDQALQQSKLVHYVMQRRRNKPALQLDRMTSCNNISINT